MNNNTVLPLKTLISLASDIEEALSIASFHLEHQIKTVKGVWDDTAIPELCNYYSCLFTLRKLLPSNILSSAVVEQYTVLTKEVDKQI